MYVTVCVNVCVQVSEQVDSLRVLFTDPVDYLVTPRVLASMIAGPILNVLCFCMGEQKHTGKGPGLCAARHLGMGLCRRAMQMTHGATPQHPTNATCLHPSSKASCPAHPSPLFLHRPQAQTCPHD